MSQNKKRTVAYPHRVFNKVAIFMSKYNKVADTYESVTDLGESKLTITASSSLNPKDGRVFDYILSRTQALGMTNTTLEIDTKEVLDELGMDNRTENRNKIVSIYSRLVGVEVTLNWGADEIRFKLFDAVTNIDGNLTKEINLSQTFIDAMAADSAKTRYINIGLTMRSKSDYAIELAKLLQIDGQGVQLGSGKPKPIKKISHQRIVQYLSVDLSEESIKSLLRKAFNELESLGYPGYRYNGKRNLWQQK